MSHARVKLGAKILLKCEVNEVWPLACLPACTEDVGVEQYSYSTNVLYTMSNF